MLANVHQKDLLAAAAFYSIHSELVRHGSGEDLFTARDFYF